MAYSAGTFDRRYSIRGLFWTLPSVLDYTAQSWVAFHQYMQNARFHYPGRPAISVDFAAASQPAGQKDHHGPTQAGVIVQACLHWQSTRASTKSTGSAVTPPAFWHNRDGLFKLPCKHRWWPRSGANFVPVAASCTGSWCGSSMKSHQNSAKSRQIGAEPRKIRQSVHGIWVTGSTTCVCGRTRLYKTLILSIEFR